MTLTHSNKTDPESHPLDCCWSRVETLRETFFPFHAQSSVTWLRRELISLTTRASHPAFQVEERRGLDTHSWSSRVVWSRLSPWDVNCWSILMEACGVSRRHSPAWSRVRTVRAEEPWPGFLCVWFPHETTLSKIKKEKETDLSFLGLGLSPAPGTCDWACFSAQSNGTKEREVERSLPEN